MHYYFILYLFFIVVNKCPTLLPLRHSDIIHHSLHSVTYVCHRQHFFTNGKSNLSDFCVEGSWQMNETYMPGCTGRLNPYTHYIFISIYRLRHNIRSSLYAHQEEITISGYLISTCHTILILNLKYTLYHKFLLLCCYFFY